MRKIVSQILALTMICGMFSVMPAKAETTELYPDYVPASEIPGNLLGEFNMTPEREYANGTSRNTTKVDLSKNVKYGYKWGSSNCYTPVTLIAQQSITSGEAGYIGLYGVMFQTWYDKGEGNKREWIQFKNDKSYVVSLMIRDAEYNASKPTYIQMCLTNEIAGSVSYSKEYGKEGYLTTPDYERYSDTIKPAAGFYPDKTNTLVIGFDEIEPGAAISIRTEFEGDVYIGEEVAFDIENKTVTPEEDICQGEDIKVKASVLNQGGKAGYLNQNFNWYALDEDKTALVEGFTFHEGTDGEATVTIASEVPVGRYAIVAESKDYAGFIKTTYIDVLPERIKDSSFEAVIPNSVIKDSTKKTSVKATDTGVIDLSFSNSDTIATAKAKSNISNNTMGMEGLEIHPAFNGFASGFNFEAGKTYAFSAMVKKSSNSLANTDVYFNVAIGQDTSDTLSYTNEYGEEGLKLTNEWQKFAATITVSADYDKADTSNRHLYMGMPTGTLAGSSFDMKLDGDYYLAENTAVGMIIETIPQDAKTVLKLDNSLKVKGGYANQVGALSLDEQNLNWYVLNSARKEIVDTFDIEVSEDGKNAEIRATEITKSGKYYLVVENEEKDGSLKRVSIEITADVPEMTEAIVESIKNNSKEVLTDRISIFADGLDIGFYSKSALDNEKCAELLKNEIAAADISTKQDLKNFVEKAIFISTLNEGSKIELLLNNKGKFVTIDALDIKKYDKDGVTIYNLFVDDSEYEYIDKDGIKNILVSMKKKDFDSFSAFDEKLLEEIVLNIIAYPGVYGTSYVEDVLTEENGERIGLDMTKYIGYDDDQKDEKNEEIARNLYTKESLQTVLDDEPEEDNGGGNSGGGFSGGAPIIKGEDIKEPEVKPAPAVEEEVVNFTDVSDSHWAYADIYHLKELGVVSGVGYNTFLPDGTVTREQFVKMFVEAMEYDISAAKDGFSDVKEDAWYAPYVATAVEKGIITGITSDTFGVGKPITRQDVCVIISRAMGSVDGSAEIFFDDKDIIEEYAYNAVSYLTSFNVIKGFDDNTFRPKDYCTRAQVAKIICTILNMKGLVIG